MIQSSFLQLNFMKYCNAETTQKNPERMLRDNDEFIGGSNV
jgi:hypothetical protein